MTMNSIDYHQARMNFALIVGPGFCTMILFPTDQSGTKPNLVAKILATNFGDRLA